MSYLEVTKRNLPRQKNGNKLRILPKKQEKKESSTEIRSFFILNPYAHLGISWYPIEEDGDEDLGCVCMGYESGGFHDVIGCEYDK